MRPHELRLGYAGALKKSTRVCENIFGRRWIAAGPKFGVEFFARFENPLKNRVGKGVLAIGANQAGVAEPKSCNA